MTEALQTLRRFLEERGVAHEVVEHAPTFRAGDEAQATGVEPAAMVKTLVLRDDDAYLIAAIPATRELDLERVRAATGASPHLRLATEEEIAAELPEFEVGAIPPLGVRV